MHEPTPEELAELARRPRRSKHLDSHKKSNQKHKKRPAKTYGVNKRVRR